MRLFRCAYSALPGNRVDLLRFRLSSQRRRRFPSAFRIREDGVDVKGRQGIVRKPSNWPIVNGIRCLIRPRRSRGIVPLWCCNPLEHGVRPLMTVDSQRQGLNPTISKMSCNQTRINQQCQGRCFFFCGNTIESQSCTHTHTKNEN